MKKSPDLTCHKIRHTRYSQGLGNTHTHTCTWARLIVNIFQGNEAIKSGTLGTYTALGDREIHTQACTMHMSKIYCKYRSNKSRICRLWNMKAGALYWICLIWGQGVMDRVLILRIYREKGKCPWNMKWALNLSDWVKDWQGWNDNIGIGWLWKMLKGVCCPLSV